MRKMNEQRGVQRSMELWALTATAGAVVLLMSAGGAYAQAQGETQAAGGEAAPQTVVVTGIRRGIESAIATKKNADAVVESISAEDIGKLPDTSIAESISRLPGVASQRVAGRSQSINIRGMSGDFVGTLLNGREQVSTGDNRAVEFDQYPSELLSRVDIYKTPQANLIGQGLSATVDMQTVRPLAFSNRALVFNLRGEKNSLGKRNADSSDTGSRFSASYIDQFADRTFGVALGYARLDSPGQGDRWEAWGYTTDPNATNPDGSSAKVLGGFKAYVDSSKQVRDGLMGVFQWKPSKNFESVVDLYYSRFEKEQKTRGFEVGLPWGGATLSNAVVRDGYLVGGTFTGVKPVLRNDLNERTDELSAFGWNNQLTLGDWKAVADLSWSKADRQESILETYAGTVPGSAGARDTAEFTFDPNTGLPTLKTGLNYADPSIIKLVDSGGWGQDGYLKHLNVKDELKALRLEGSRNLDGIFSRLSAGVHYSERSKTKEVPEWWVDLKTSTRNSSGFTTAPTDLPAGLALSPTTLGFVGFGGMLSYDIPGALGSLYNLTPKVHKDIWNKNWEVTEKVATAFAMGNIDAELGPVSLRGNVGVQVVRTDQSSTAYTLPNSSDAGNVQPNTDGKTYTDVLPSLNLAFGFSNDQVVRLGLAREMMRPRLDQLRASTSYSYDVPRDEWSGDGGNPRLDPFRANAADLTYEKYFGNKGLLSAQAFYKDLKSYIYKQDVPYDFVGLTNPVTGLPNPADTIGKFNLPANGQGGTIRGWEVAASIPLNMLSSALDGFGVVASYAHTDSSIEPNGPGSTMMLPGLSKRVTNLIAYYEKYGFSARVAQRFRSEFVGEISGFGADRELVFIKPEKVVDVQLGYEFAQGPMKGLSVLLQVNNLTNAEYARQEQDGAPKEYVKYGRTVLFGLNYKL
ncbi:MAG: TonB-dependent receptor [Pseudomonadota bacterium]